MAVLTAALVTGSCATDSNVFGSGTSVTASDPSRMTRSGFLSDCVRLKPMSWADGVQCWRKPDLDAKRFDKMAEKGSGLMTLRAARTAADAPTAHRLIADALPPVVASVLDPQELETMRQRLIELPEPPAYVRLAKEDLWGAVAVAILVCLATVPVAIPFLLLSDAGLAMRLSNAAAVVLLFVAGYRLGRSSGRTPWRMGISMVVIGALMVGLCIALGG